MSRVCLILFLLSVVSCYSYSDDSEFKLQNPFRESEDEFCFTERDCLYSSIDTVSFYEILHYSYRNGNKQMIDSTELNGYGSMLYSFKSQKSDSYVIVWKIEHEHYPTFNTYYVKDGKILKIGEWGIFTPPLADEYYDYFDYSVEDIRIHQKNDEIGISFLKDIEFVDYSEGYSNDWTSYKAGTFTLSFNVVSGEVRRIESGE